MYTYIMHNRAMAGGGILEGFALEFQNRIMSHMYERHAFRMRMTVTTPIRVTSFIHANFCHIHERDSNHVIHVNESRNGRYLRLSMCWRLELEWLQ